MFQIYRYPIFVKKFGNLSFNPHNNFMMASINISVSYRKKGRHRQIEKVIKIRAANRKSWALERKREGK